MVAAHGDLTSGRPWLVVQPIDRAPKPSIHAFALNLVDGAPLNAYAEHVGRAVINLHVLVTRIVADLERANHIKSDLNGGCSAAKRVPSEILG